MKTALLATALLFCFTTTALALDTPTQIMVVGNGTAKSQPQDTTGLYLHGSLFIEIGGDPLVFTYVGPDFQFGQLNLKLLTGTFSTASGGLSATASVWLFTPLFGELGMFTEVDTYFPVNGGHEHQAFFSYTEVAHPLLDGQVLGLGLEVFGDTEDVYEAAFGPTLTMGHGTLFVAYDTTPSQPDSRIFFRFMFRL